MWLILNVFYDRKQHSLTGFKISISLHPCQLQQKEKRKNQKTKKQQQTIKTHY